MWCMWILIRVRDALLRSLHHSSIYILLIIANKKKGARFKTIGQVLHTRLISNSRKGTALLRFIYDQLHNSKLAKRTHPNGRMPTLPLGLTLAHTL